jgi:hypothetical protein
MKKRLILFTGCALALLSCGTIGTTRSSGKGIKGVPVFVNEAYLNASEDVLVGIGSYKIGDDMSRLSQGKTIAETRARADIARQLQTIVKNMVTDYTATSELDPKAQVAFQESITQSLAKADLRGSRTIKMDTADGVLWVVMEYSKSLASKDFNAAASAAKLAVPKAAAFNALSRMDSAFDKESGGGPKPSTD